MSKAWTALIGAYFLFVCGVIAAGAMAPGGGDRLAVVTWPGGASAADVVARAGGSLLQIGSGDWVAVASGTGADFSERLYRAGALLVTSPSIAEACL
ncbi:hypothetical protein [Stappia sp.]|uniref:hypothetical protein n=1 Tax=Stappia sp. TaxID=1870903 RepID=UPI0032D991EA